MRTHMRQAGDSSDGVADGKAVALSAIREGLSEAITRVSPARVVFVYCRDPPSLEEDLPLGVARRARLFELLDKITADAVVKYPVVNREIDRDSPKQIVTHGSEIVVEHAEAHRLR